MDHFEDPAEGPLPSPMSAEIVGQAMEVTPTAAEQSTAADRARGRTTIQVGTPAAIVVIGSWIARSFGIDLDPGVGEEMPPEVVAAWIALVTVGMAVWMNPKPKSQE